jgi:hypothetical protein
MSIADRILRSLEESEKLSEFQPFREMLRLDTKLPAREWVALCNLVRSKRIFNVLREDLTKREALMIGCAFRKVALPHADDIIEILVKKDDSNTPFLLALILKKRKKIEGGPIMEYMHGAIARGLKPRHLQLLEAMYRNYPELIDGRIVELCRSYGHELCREIAKAE